MGFSLADWAARLFSEAFPIVAKNILIFRAVRFYWHCKPRDIDELFPVDIFGGDVVPPCAAAEGDRAGHAVEEGSTVAGNHGLADHDAARAHV